MFGQDRRLREAERPTVAILLTWLAVSILLLAVASDRILQNQAPDPDDVLRLVQVRDLLAGQGWYDLHQYRITAPDGTLMHWSRLVDLPIAGLILFFSLFMDVGMAERVTMVVIPLTALMLTMLVVGRLTWRLFDRQTAICACATMVLMPLMPSQFQPMRIDHHSWQILSVAFALWAISWRNPARGGMAAGLAMAAGLIISLETIFMAAGFALILTMRWMRDHRQRWWLVSYLQALAMGLVVLFALTRGLPDLAAHCDAISPQHLGFFLIVALGAGALAVLPPLPRIPVLIALGGFGLAGLAFVGWSSPQCLAPPFAGLDPLVRDFWYLNVTEGRPVWYRHITEQIPAILQPGMALAISILIASRSRDWMRVWWFEFALLLTIAFAGGVLTYRSMAFAGVLSAIPMGWFLGRMLKRFRSHDRPLSKLSIAMLLYLVFLPGVPASAVVHLMSQGPKPTSSTVAGSSCELRTNARRLNALPASTLFAPFDIGPAILLHTHHGVVASGHHRAEQAMRDVIYSFTHSAAEARRYVDLYKADYVVACLDLHEAKNLQASGGPSGLMSRLIAGVPPEWLEPVDIGGPDTFKVWRVVRGQAATQEERAEAAMPGESSAPAR